MCGQCQGRCELMEGWGLPSWTQRTGWMWEVRTVQQRCPEQKDGHPSQLVLLNCSSFQSPSENINTECSPRCQVWGQKVLPQAELQALPDILFQIPLCFFLSVHFLRVFISPGFCSAFPWRSYLTYPNFFCLMKPGTTHPGTKWPVSSLGSITRCLFSHVPTLPL